MKWVIRIKPGKKAVAKRDLGIRLRPRRTYVRFMPTRDTYTSRKMATRFDTKKEALSHVEYAFEEVIPVR
jgi:hypothetical protein